MNFVEVLASFLDSLAFGRVVYRSEVTDGLRHLATANEGGIFAGSDEMELIFEEAIAEETMYPGGIEGRSVFGRTRCIRRWDNWKILGIVMDGCKHTFGERLDG